MKTCEAPARIRPKYLLGLIFSFLAVFPISAASAYFYRFPFPFAGYLSGTEYVLPSLLAVLFYEVVCGGFVVLGLVGAAMSWILSRCRIHKDWQTFSHILGGFIVAFLCVGTLVILDKIIGPW